MAWLLKAAFREQDQGAGSGGRLREKDQGVGARNRHMEQDQGWNEGLGQISLSDWEQKDIPSSSSP